MVSRTGETNYGSFVFTLVANKSSEGAVQLADGIKHLGKKGSPAGKDLV